MLYMLLILTWDLPFSLMMIFPMILQFMHSLKLRREKSLQRDKRLWKKEQKEEGLWPMYFYGFVAKVGVGAGVYIISPIKDFKALSYKLTFECTNNVAEYEALLLGLNALKDLGAKRVQVLGDSELVIN